MEDPQAIKDLQSLTPVQQQELQGVLKNPLTGRHVMIPITSKAFVVGSLKPAINSDGEEIVLVRDQTSLELKQTPRKDVYNYLQEERLKRQEQQGKKNAAKPDPKKDEAKDTKKSIHSTAEQKDTKTSSATPPVLPYFDIKEEIDDSGNVLRSEAVNVTKQLELVSKHSNGDTAMEESKEDMVENNTGSNNIDAEDEFKEEIPVDDNEAKTKPLSDQDYQSLSERLEELARLEEEAEAKSSENALSALRLQSKGWSKGFLGGEPKQKMSTKPKPKPLSLPKVDETKPTTPNNNGPDSKDISVPPQPQVDSEKSSESAPSQETEPLSKETEKSNQNCGSKSGWSKGFLNSAPSDKKLKKEIRSDVQEVRHGDEKRSKKVSFQSNVAEVREIPRVGQTSLSGLKVSPPPQPSDTAGPARPFDSTVFSGVVKERPVRPLVPGTKSKTAADGKPTKKLSKFAQERMQNNN